MTKTIAGFSKLNKAGKQAWLAKHFYHNDTGVIREWEASYHPDTEIQKAIDGFSENTISNFHLPYSVAPNVIINGQPYCVPMVIEESSVVAAASAAAKYWSVRGGFHAEIIDTQKVGQLHFAWKGRREILRAAYEKLKKRLLEDTMLITENMQQRGGGIREIRLIDMTDKVQDCYQLLATFETCDSMGANFINTVLEQFGESLKDFIATTPELEGEPREVQVVMAILSNYTPDCLVQVYVECPVEDLTYIAGYTPEEFAQKFYMAVQIARQDVYRATTHNKGIFNGIDAVVIATGNDFRAIEASGHAYAARDGQYRSLSDCRIEAGKFYFELEIPLALGTVGGLTSLHPLARRSLEMLGNPGAGELMQIVAAVGLAQNFAAVRSLITTGIQQGHMKMHLMNILRHLQASEEEVAQAAVYFNDKTISFSSVRAFLEKVRESGVIRIIEFDAAYAEDFRIINEAWISEQYQLEDADRKVLNHPQSYIIDRGGYIFLAQDGDKIVGTCAMIQVEDGTFELAKMAVIPEYQGRKIGKILAEKVIEKAKAVGARRLYLESNKKAVAACALYRRLGFADMPEQTSPYARADVFMELIL